MTRKQVRAAATALVAYLPPIPQPWSVDELCRRLAEQRGRVMLVHSLELPSLPFGLWYDDGKRDHIIYRAELTGYHRDHVILHEICHMLARHNTLASSSDAGSSNGDTFELLEQVARNRHSDSQEELAEIFASMVLKLACQLRASPVGEFERRASAAFGAG